ncbi:MAG TPA: tetratricopeptide repeat protein [Gemmatimonadales bacterium]|nr:tetratricopeptide repeat protein [Gemmatimonadales bacterium]
MKPATGPATAPEAAATEKTRFLAKLEKNRKLLTYAFGAVVAVGVIGWLYTVSNRNKAAMASDALDAAQNAFDSGNLPGASAGFQRVILSYGGTDAAYQAQLGSNSVRLASGQAQLAVDELRKFANSNPPPFYASGAWMLMGNALENLKKYGDAAAAYLKAADVAPEDYRKVEALLAAARSYRLAGKEKESVDVLRRIVSKFAKEIPGVPEAQVRLAEQTKGAM